MLSDLATNSVMDLPDCPPWGKHVARLHSRFWPVGAACALRYERWWPEATILARRLLAG
jgi:hypothetical protein